MTAAKLLLYKVMYGHAMGIYLSSSQTHEWCGQDYPYFILTLSPSSSCSGKKWRFSDAHNSSEVTQPVSDRDRLRDGKLGAKPHSLTILCHQTVDFLMQ